MRWLHRVEDRGVRVRRFSTAVTAAALTAAAPVAARAQTTFTWTNNAGGDASGSWSVPANWNNGAGPVAEGSGNVADFTKLNITTDSTVTLDGDHTIGAALFGDTGGSFFSNWILLPGSPATSKLTLSSSLATPGIGYLSRLQAPLAGKQGARLAVGLLDVPAGASTITGNVIILGGVTMGQDQQFGSGASLDVSQGGRFFANGHSQILKDVRIGSGGDFDTSGFETGTGSQITVSDTLTMNAGQNGFTGLNIGQGSTVVVGKKVVMVGGPIFGQGVLRLGGDVESNYFTGSISTAIDLNGATRRFSVNGAVNSQLGVGSLTSQSGVGGLRKVGEGLLSVGVGTNYTGPTIVEDGRLFIPSLPSSTLTLSGGRISGVAFGGTQLTLGPGASSIDGGLTVPDNWVRSPGAALEVDFGLNAAAVLNSKPLPPVASATPTTPVLGYAWVKEKTGVNQADFGFAYVNGAGHVVRYTAAAPISTSAAGPSLVMDPATNYTMTLDSNLTLGAAAVPTANSLLLQLGGPTVSRTLNLGGKTLSLTSGGLIVNNPQDLDITIDNGRLGAPDAELILHRAGTGNLILGPNLQLSGGTGSVTFDRDYNSTAVTTIKGNTSTFSGGAMLGFPATVVIDSGTVKNGNTLMSGPLGTGTITFKGGTLVNGSATTLRLDNPIAIASRLSTNSAFILGGPVTLVGTPGDVLTLGGPLTIEKPIGESTPGLGLRVGGVTLAAANTYTGPTVVVSQTVFAARQDIGDVEIPSGGSALFQTSQHFKSLAVAGPFGQNEPSGYATVTPHGSGPLKAVATGGLSVPGRFDLTDNALAVRANTSAGQTTADLLRDLTILIRNGRTPSDSRNGLFSSAADADPRTGLGIMVNNNGQGQPAFPTLGGESLTTDDVIARWTFLGDANLDGTVGPGDFNLLASHFGLSGQSWATGDFNLDGTVGPGDFNLLASHFGLALPGFTSNVSAADWAALNSFGSAVAPEPTAAAMLAMGCFVPALRRRRR